MADLDIHAGRERRNKLARAVEFEWQKNDSTVMSFFVWYEIDPADLEVGITSRGIRVTEAECFQVTHYPARWYPPASVLWESDGSPGDILVGEILGEYLPTGSHTDEHDEIARLCWEQQEAFADHYDEESER